MRAAPLAALAALVAPALASCVGSTGSPRVEVHAAVAGPADVVSGTPLEFVSGRGFRVALTTARLHVGALYLNQSMPVSGAQATSCVLPGTYVAQITSGADFDVLSPTPQPFPNAGEGIATPALAGEVWLFGGDIDALDDPTPILVLEGTAEVAGERRAFKAKLTIGQNRVIPASDPAQPGANPICKQRIVSPVPTHVTPQADGALVLRFDPRALFLNVDFSQLRQFAADPPAFGFVDEPADQPSINLFNALHSAGGVYSFEWVPSRP